MLRFIAQALFIWAVLFGVFGVIGALLLLPNWVFACLFVGGFVALLKWVFRG